MQKLNVHDVLARATKGGTLSTGKLTDAELRYLADTAEYLRKVVRKAGRSL
jgi:hypothetical protein